MDTGYKTAGTCSGEGWTNPDYSRVLDSNVASYLIPINSDAPVIIWTNFGFSVPNGARIVGARISTYRGVVEASRDVRDITIKWYYGGDQTTAFVGANWNSGSFYTNVFDAVAIWSGLTPAVARNSGFGVSFIIKNYNIAATSTAAIDSFQMKLFYEVPKAHGGLC